MTTLLQLNTSLFSNHGQSTQLADQFVSELRAQQPDLQLFVRDLAKSPVPHLTLERFQAFNTPAAARTAEQQAEVALSDTLIAELRAADIVVIGLPLYNFNAPSSLHTYFDHVARSQVTFRYTENGPEGLLKGKRAYVFATRGGKYAGTPGDSSSTWLRTFLGFIGIDDVQFVYAEGLALGEASKSEALAAARVALTARVNAETRVGQTAHAA